MTDKEIDKVFYAAYDGSFDTIKNFLDDGMSPNIQNETGKTLLHVACEDGYTGLLELLLEYGADPNIEDSDGDTPIDYAIFRKDEEYQQVLLKHGAIKRDREPAIVRNWQLINEGQEQVRAIQNLLSLIEKGKKNTSYDGEK